MLIGLLLAALGCCYIGAKTVRTNVQNLSSLLSNYLRKRIAFFTKSYFRSVLFGIFFNVAMGGDVSMVSYSLAAFVAGELISFAPALVMSIWGNLGTSLIFYLAAINMRLLSLYMIGIAGVLYFFINNKKYQSLLGVVIGIALLVFGMNLVKESAPLWQDNENVKAIFNILSGSWVLLFVFGIAIRVIFQLLWINVIISIIMLHTGMVNLSDIIVMHIASRFYTGWYTWLLSHHYQAPARQLMIFQACFSYLAGVIAIATLICENYFHIPFIQAIVVRMSPESSFEVVNLSLVVNIFTGLLLALNKERVVRLIERWYPFAQNLEEQKPHYIQLAQISNPYMSLDALEKEQQDLLKRMSEYFHCLKESRAFGKKNAELNSLAYSFQVVLEKVNVFLNELSESELSGEDHSHYVKIMYRQQLLKDLEYNLEGWMENMNILLSIPDWREELLNHLKSFELLFKDMIEAFQSKDPFKVGDVISRCEKKDEWMDIVKFQWLIRKDDKRLQTAFYEVHQKYEVCVWILQRVLTLSL